MRNSTVSNEFVDWEYTPVLGIPDAMLATVATFEAGPVPRSRLTVPLPVGVHVIV